MTTAQIVETSVNSSFQNYTHPDDHTSRTPVNNDDVDESTNERVYNQRKLTNRTAPLWKALRQKKKRTKGSLGLINLLQYLLSIKKRNLKLTPGVKTFANNEQSKRLLMS